mmetsp:Transcript_126359/g.404544  ORF Transcript_126359/g.404544 Transcript_126359/m.404544 type:complete len:456 (+) Transcript_126359:81-1448(+)
MEEVSSGDTAWVLASTSLVLIMTPGLAFFYGGLVRGTNVVNTMMMSIISMGIIPIVWLVVGFSLSFGSGGGPIIGDFNYVGLWEIHDKVWPDTSLPTLVFAAYQMGFAIIAAAIISGAVVERMRFSAYAVFIMLWSILVYAPVCHWVWGPGGWIHAMGAKDFAGGTVVHETTAVSALVLCVLLGPRAHHGEGVEPHNVPFVILGAALLWFGWSGFNGGSALAADWNAALAVINSYEAAAASLVTWTVLERFHLKRYSAVGTVTGAIVGLVIITPAAGYVTPVGAVLMGVIGCVFVYPSFQVSHAKVDDSLDAFPCHGVSGFVGTVLTGLFDVEGGLFYGGGWHLLGVQVVAGLATAAYAAIVTVIIFCALRLCMHVRVPEDMEFEGLDTGLHGYPAYGKHAPDNDGGAPKSSLTTPPPNSSGVAIETARAGSDHREDERMQEEGSGAGLQLAREP